MLKSIRFSIFIISLFCFITGYINCYYSLMLVSAFAMLINNIIFCVEDIKRRILFMFFNLMFFLFLMGRQLINCVRGDHWNYFKKPQNYFSLTSVFLSLVFLFIGAILSEIFLDKNKISEKTLFFKKPYYSLDFINTLQNISLFLFYVSAIFKIILETEKLILMSGKQYEELYVGYQSKLPSLFYSISKIALPALCVFLSTYPKKKKTFLALAVYVLTSIPILLVGARAEFMLSLLFAFIYYFLRDNLFVKLDREKWLGKFEKTLIAVMLPILVAVLSLYNYMRSDLKAERDDPSFLIVDFIYKQGVSFNVLSIGHEAIPNIKNGESKNYTFGPIIDYLKYSSLSRYLLEIEDLPPGNSLEKALYSNSFSHSMSYQTRGEEYLSGRGWGSSYILETYADFGWGGVLYFNIVIGFILMYMIKWLKRSWLSCTICLMILSSIFFIPRTETTEFLIFLITPHFWATILICSVFSLLLLKKYTIKTLIKSSCYRVDRNSV